MHALDILGDPVRRRILELLGDHRTGGVPSLSAGDIAVVISREFSISQPAVSQHLKVLRESGFATCTADGQRRLYAIEDAPFREVDAWLDRYRRFWGSRLDALDTEIRRGKRNRRSAGPGDRTKGDPT